MKQRKHTLKFHKSDSPIKIPIYSCDFSRQNLFLFYGLLINLSDKLADPLNPLILLWFQQVHPGHGLFWLWIIEGLRMLHHNHVPGWQRNLDDSLEKDIKWNLTCTSPLAGSSCFRKWMRVSLSAASIRLHASHPHLFMSTHSLTIMQMRKDTLFPAHHSKSLDAS